MQHLRTTLLIILAAAAAAGLFGCAQPNAPAPQELPGISMPTPTPKVDEPVIPKITPSPTPEPTPVIPGRESSLYIGRLELNRETSTVNGELWLEYVNTGGDTLYAISFHLYPNTISPGSLKVESVALNGRAAYYDLEREDLLRLPLAIELEPWQSCSVYFTFTLTLSEVYGLRWKQIDLQCPMPVAAEYDGGWVTDQGMAGHTQSGEYRVVMAGISGLDVESEMQSAGEGYFTAEQLDYFAMTLKE